MGTKLNRRALRVRHVAIGVLALTAPGTAVALRLAAQALGATSAPALRIEVARHTLRYGHYESVHGTASSSEAGQRVELQLDPSGASAWEQLGHSTIGPAGRFSFRVRLRRSGGLRAISPRLQAEAGSAPASLGYASRSPAGPSAPQHVFVGAELRVPRRSLALKAGRRVAIRGSLLPGQAGRRVRLITRTRSGWRTLARTWTSRRGGFELRYAVQATGTRWLRVSFAGDRANRGTWALAGKVTGLVARVASWYDDAGSTACGFHAHFGVASRTLPCGTRVTFKYGCRSVVATVDDRGPYVWGRDYDLNQNVAGALGMYAVATVLASR